MAISVARQVRFWLLTVVMIAAALWLLHGILLPFVAGTALAYLLDPIANRLERLGLNRLAAALLIVGIFVLALLIMAILLVAVPLAAAVGVLTRFALRQYLASPVYTGAPDESAGAIPGPGPALGRS
jgi:predicted PurR-regulated permease PerM